MSSNNKSYSALKQVFFCIIQRSYTPKNCVTRFIYYWVFFFFFLVSNSFFSNRWRFQIVTNWLKTKSQKIKKLKRLPPIIDVRYYCPKETMGSCVFFFLMSSWVSTHFFFLFATRLNAFSFLTEFYIIFFSLDWCAALRGINPGASPVKNQSSSKLCVFY